MKLNIGMEFEANLNSDKNFLNELIIETRNQFQQEAIGKFTALILESWDRQLCDLLVACRDGGETTALLCAHGIPVCCKEPKIRRYRRDKKKLSTSIGALKYCWNRMRCKNCKKTIVPLREILAIKKYQTESNEFQKLACETVVQQSFRRSCKHLTQIGGIKIDRMKLHRILGRADADTIDANVRGKDVKYLIADGTGFPEWKPTKTKPDESSEMALPEPQVSSVKVSQVKERKSDLKVVISLNSKDEMIPVGVWAKRSWKHLAQQIKNANNHPKLLPKPIADILLCDGEEALIREMGPLAHEIQRCQWHMTYEFYHLMKYQEKCETNVSHEWTDKLYQTIKLGIPESHDLEARLTLEALILKAEKSLDDVIIKLRESSLFMAATYVSNAKENLFTFLRHWIETGEVAPKVTSRIERLMRELGRRVKKIGFNWSAKGAARITRILLKILAGKNLWENEWREKLCLKNAVSLSLKGVYLRSLSPT